jgi:hypothetical protein
VGGDMVGTVRRVSGRGFFLKTPRNLWIQHFLRGPGRGSALLPRAWPVCVCGISSGETERSKPDGSFGAQPLRRRARPQMRQTDTTAANYINGLRSKEGKVRFRGAAEASASAASSSCAWQC